MSICFRGIWGASWGPLLAPFYDFPLILGIEMGDGFQFHVLGDPGMEATLECRGCMCYKHSQNHGSAKVSPSPLIH